MSAGSLIAVAGSVLALVAAGCGSDEEATSTAASVPANDLTRPGEATGPLPPGAERPAQVDPGGAAGQASPEAPAEGPETGELSEEDEEAVTASVGSYVLALNRHDAALACALFAPGALRLSELPARGGGCTGSLRASIGTRPSGGGPAWKRTRIVQVTAVSVEGGGARVTATVVHRFADRNQPSIEEDVIYLQRVGDRWLLAKPSTTFYRAVGYADPPLRALTPP